MTQTYQTRRRAEPAPVSQAPQGAKGPSLEQLQKGAMPTQEQMGHQVDLPEAIRGKMEASFGADLSAVRLYESQAVADAGANAVAQGSRIAFAPARWTFPAPPARPCWATSSPTW